MCLFFLFECVVLHLHLPLCILLLFLLSIIDLTSQDLARSKAIASKEAAEIYGLEILNSSIQTIENNITRFVIVEKNKQNK